MKRIRMVIGLLVAAGIAAGGLVPGSTGASAQSAPDAKTILRQSIVKMKTSLYTAQVSGRSTVATGTQKASFTMTGACSRWDTRIAGQLRLKGTTIGQKTPVALNEEDGLIWAQSPGWVAVFTRPATPGKAWRTTDPFDSTGAAMFGVGCPQIMVRQLEQQPLVGLTLLGTVTVGQEPAWHLRGTMVSSGGKLRTDLYIGRQSLFVLRVGAVVDTSQMKQTSTVDYSGFNRPVRIALPAVKPPTGRAMHTALRLPDGRVFVLGGAGMTSGKQIVMNGWADVYNPATGTWSRVGGLPAVPVVSSVGVARGHVLLSGYFYPVSAGAQLFDASTKTWTAAPAMLVPRAGQVSAALRDGRLLIAGGYNMKVGRIEMSTEIFDPSLGRWSRSGNLKVSLPTGARTAVLPDGRVLVLGTTTAGAPTAQIFQPRTGTWTLASAPTQPRVAALLTLSGGTVLALGAGPNGPLATAIYDPARNAWSGVQSGPAAGDNFASVVLANGKVLVAGGAQAGGPSPHALNSAWVFNPADGTWTAVGSMKQARSLHTMTLLKSGKVLVVGGFGSMSIHGPSNPLSSAEIYDPATARWSWTGSMK